MGFGIVRFVVDTREDGKRTMTQAPERIRAWAGPARGWNYGSFILEEAGRNLKDPGTEYTRRDIAAAAVLAERESTTVEVLEMNLSDGRTDYFVQITNGDRSYSTNRYPSHRLNRAEYEADYLKHVLLGGPRPRLMDAKYADKPEATRAGKDPAQEGK